MAYLLKRAKLPEKAAEALKAQAATLKEIDTPVPKDKHPARIDGGVWSPTEINDVQQVDLLMLPADPTAKDKRNREARYALVLVDLASRRVGAWPLHSKVAADTLKALKEIYKHDKTLKPPIRMELDGGAEFAGVFASYLRSNGTFIRVGLPGRSQQQRAVENMNKVIGTALLTLQKAQELETGEPDRSWVDNLQAIVAAANEHHGRPEEQMAQQQADQQEQLREVVDGGLPPKLAPGEPLLLLGTPVRVALMKPEDIASGKRVHGTFRAADHRFSVKIYTISQVLLTPAQYPRYMVKGITSTTFAQNELLVVSKEALAEAQATEEKKPKPQATAAKPAAAAAKAAPKPAEVARATLLAINEAKQASRTSSRLAAKPAGMLPTVAAVLNAKGAARRAVKK